jgi:hypothetical protein
VTCAPQVVLSVKRIDTAGTTGALNHLAAARGELPYRPSPNTEVPRSWREQLEQESASNMSTELPTCRICHSGHLCARTQNTQHALHTTRTHIHKQRIHIHTHTFRPQRNGRRSPLLAVPVPGQHEVLACRHPACTKNAHRTRSRSALPLERLEFMLLRNIAHAERVHPHAGGCGTFKKKLVSQQFFFRA